MLYLTGCAMAQMKEVAFVEQVNNETAMVNFVRPKVFWAGGAEAEIWDGSKFIGTLSEGTMIQYQTTPGPHVFMVFMQGFWGRSVHGSLEAGKTYYIKYNHGVFNVFSLNAADATDPRIKIWNEVLTPVTIDTSSSKPVPQDLIDAAKKLMEEVNSGSASSSLIGKAHAL